MKDFMVALITSSRHHLHHVQLHLWWRDVVSAMSAGAAHNGNDLNLKSRSLIDIGILIFMLTTAFNAGIQYSRINSLGKIQDQQQAQINGMQRDEGTVVAELAAVKQILTDIRDENRGGK